MPSMEGPQREWMYTSVLKKVQEDQNDNEISYTSWKPTLRQNKAPTSKAEAADVYDVTPKELIWPQKKQVLITWSIKVGTTTFAGDLT